MSDYDPRPGINQRLEELQAENARLRAALEDVRRRILDREQPWWIDDPNRGGFDLEMIEAALLGS